MRFSSGDDDTAARLHLCFWLEFWIRRGALLLLLSGLLTAAGLVATAFAFAMSLTGAGSWILWVSYSGVVMSMLGVSVTLFHCWRYGYSGILR